MFKKLKNYGEEFKGVSASLNFFKIIVDDSQNSDVRNRLPWTGTCAEFDIKMQQQARLIICRVREAIKMPPRFTSSHVNRLNECQELLVQLKARLKNNELALRLKMAMIYNDNTYFTMDKNKYLAHLSHHTSLIDTLFKEIDVLHSLAHSKLKVYQNYSSNSFFAKSRSYSKDTAMLEPSSLKP